MLKVNNSQNNSNTLLSVDIFLTRNFTQLLLYVPMKMTKFRADTSDSFLITFRISVSKQKSFTYDKYVLRRKCTTKCTFNK